MQRTLGSAFLLLAITLAAPARASEGGLEIFPDLFLGAAPLQSRFVQLIVLFVLLVVPVNRLVLQPLLGVLDERGRRIEGTRKRAESIGSQAETVLAKYGAAVEEARKQAEEQRKGTLEGARGEQNRVLADARGDAEREVSRARGEVAAALAAARGTLRDESQALAREAAARVLGRSLS